LLALVTDDGRPVVRDVILTAASAQDALHQSIPDLVVHWDNGAFASTAGITNSDIRINVDAKRLTGQHAFEGFCILKNAHDVHEDSLPAKEMYGLLRNLIFTKPVTRSVE